MNTVFDLGIRRDHGTSIHQLEYSRIMGSLTFFISCTVLICFLCVSWVDILIKEHLEFYGLGLVR